MIVTFDLDDEAFDKLTQRAAEQRREANAQAEVMVLEALGLWPQKSKASGQAKSRPKPPATRPAPVSTDGGGIPKTQLSYSGS